MNSLAIPFPGLTAPSCQGVSLFGLPTQRSAKRRLSASADEVVKSISSILDDMIEEVISKRTEAEFLATVAEVLPRYFELMFAYGRIVSTIVPRDTIVRLSADSFCELESNIREHGVSSFGAAMCERAVFTVWTLRKISELIDALEQARVDGEKEEQERKFVREFFLNILNSRFYVDCLTTSMKTKQPLYPDVLPIIDNGLKSAVDAYAWAKQAVNLRTKKDESVIQEYLTDDDDLLVDASMRDLEQTDLR